MGEKIKVASVMRLCIGKDHSAHGHLCAQVGIYVLLLFQRAS